jgi:hypothetical protein
VGWLLVVLQFPICAEFEGQDHRRYHEGMAKVVRAVVYHRRREAILKRREEQECLSLEMRFEAITTI